MKASNSDIPCESRAKDWLKLLPCLSEEAKAELKMALNEEELQAVDAEMWE